MKHPSTILLSAFLTMLPWLAQAHPGHSPESSLWHQLEHGGYWLIIFTGLIWFVAWAIARRNTQRT